MQTENSETTEKLINLGKQIVDELGRYTGQDMLVKWISHYLAQQIITAESATGDEKEKANTMCCDTILKLWSHRDEFPNKNRPFKEFDQIFETLNRINPDEPRPYYLPAFDDELTDKEPLNAQSWLDIAIGADRIARELIQISLSQAAILATNESSEKWLAAVDELNNTGESTVFKMITDQNQPADDENAKASKIEALKKRLTLIESLMENGELVCQILSQELEDLRAEAE